MAENSPEYRDGEDDWDPSTRSPRFRLNSPMVHDAGGEIPPEWDLRCLRCGYNLTGLTTRRCPECGDRFDPRETWLTARRDAMTRDEQLPRYVAYTAMAIAVLILAAMAWKKPQVAVPFLLIPVVEIVGLHLGVKRNRGRVLLFAICAVLALGVWFS